MCILVTFSLSIITIYALGYFKKCLLSDKPELIKCLLSGGLFIFTIWLVYHLNQKLHIDYGFIGCMIPVIVSLFDFRLDLDSVVQ